MDKKSICVCHTGNFMCCPTGYFVFVFVFVFVLWFAI